MSEEKSMHWFELHWQKILGATKGWKDDEFGAYVKLLIEQFDNGFIPDDPAELDRLITTRKKNWPRLKKKFTAPSEPGQLRNTFMITIRTDAHAKSAKNAESGSKGGKAKKANAIANATATGTANATETLQRNGSQPVTSNQEPVKEKVKKEGDWESFPGQALQLELMDIEISGAIEWVYHLKQTLINSDRVISFWAAFRLNLTGDKFYRNRAELMQHFRNWLKIQDFTKPEPAKTESTPVRSLIENRTNDILNQFS